MNFAVLQFPASNCDQDAVHVLRNVLGHSARLLWHKERSLGDVDAVIIPGGFSFGDYLRTGAIARFSPVMEAVQTFAANGGLVLGICNGLQILCEAGLLPGAFIRNRSLQFRCEHIFLKTIATDSPFTNRIATDKLLRVPIAHGEGCYFADEQTLARLREQDQVLKTVELPDVLNIPGNAHITIIDKAAVFLWTSHARRVITVPVDRIAERSIGQRKKGGAIF